VVVAAVIEVKIFATAKPIARAGEGGFGTEVRRARTGDIFAGADRGANRFANSAVSVGFSRSHRPDLQAHLL